jgi:alpha-tubulin suppressor-like RCC1 family protein
MKTYMRIFHLGLAVLISVISFSPLSASSPITSTVVSAVTVISLWGGARSSLALKSDGTVWAWGANNCSGLGSGACGKLGDGTQITRTIPIQVHGPGNIGYLTSITAIMAGEHENYALNSDGTLWAWGGNFFGQLGDGTYTNTVTPVQVSGLISVTALGGRGYHNLALTSDGKVWAWGWNNHGQLGITQVITSSNVPVQVVGVTNPLTVTGGGFFSVALMPDHTLKAWGANEHGQLGNGSTTESFNPVQVNPVLSNVVNVSGGWKHAVALTSDGTVWTWGDNTEGAIGIGVTSTTGISVPVQVPGLINIIGVSAGDRYTGVLKSDGTVWTWGSNAFGQLGDGTFTDHSSPKQVPNLSNVILFAARDYHNLAVKADGTVWAWGSGGNGELGNGILADSPVPVQVHFLQQMLYLPIILR